MKRHALSFNSSSNMQLTTPISLPHRLAIATAMLVLFLNFHYYHPQTSVEASQAGSNYQHKNGTQAALIIESQQQQQEQHEQTSHQETQASLLLGAATNSGVSNDNSLDNGPDLKLKKTCKQQKQQATTSLSNSMLRTFIRTNNMRAYHLDLHTYRPEAKYIGDPSFVDSSNEQHQQRCRQHLNHYNQLLSSYMKSDPMELTSSMEALKLADTFGRPDAGLLEGHQFWLGSYEQCIEFRSSQQVQGQYCLGLAQFPSWNQHDTKSSIKIGMCLPETCTSSMLNEQSDLFLLAEQMMKYQLGGPNQPLDRLKLRSIYCLPHETSQLRQLTMSSKLFISLVSMLLLTCLYATLHDYLNRKTISLTSVAGGQQQQVDSMPTISSTQRTWRTIVMESFSLIRNFEKIVDTSERKGEETTSENSVVINQGEFRFNKDLFFSSITGIKCIGLIWIIAAHCFLVGPITHKNLINLDKLTQTYLANIYLAAHLMVDSFFALSGLLASYLLFKSNSLAKLNLNQWIVLTVHRYWRLTPVYLLCYWFAKALGNQVNSGPLWDYSTAPKSPRLNCANESWLEAFLHLSDFKSPKEHCVPFAWFIANGIKFWMVTPIFLTAIYKSFRAGYSLMLAAILANICIVVSLAINSNVDMKSVIEFKPESADNMLNNMEEVYTRPYSRIGAYLVGLMAGHMIYLVEAQQQPLNISEKIKILIWSIVSMTAIVLTFVVKIAGGVELEEAAIPWVFSFCSALIRPLWALCTCWLVFALAHNQARWLSKILSASMWRILARLSFCAYLVQGEVIANLYLSASHSSPYTYTDMITRPIVATVITIALSLVVALVVEYPLIGIEELILPRRPNKVQEKAEPEGQQSAHLSEATLLMSNDIEPTKACGGSSLSGNEKGEKLKEL